MSQQDELSKFKKIISKLPEDKRKFLYKRLQSLPPEERENYIAEFNKKYYIEEKKPAEKKPEPPIARPDRAAQLYEDLRGKMFRQAPNRRGLRAFENVCT